MAPQLPQDKEPNPNLAFEALHNPVPTAPSSLTSLYARVAALGLEFRFTLSVPCPLPSVPLPGWPQPGLPVASLAFSSPFSTWQPE